MGSTHTSILEILRNANSSIRVLRSCGSALPGWRRSSLADAVAAEAGTLGHLFAREDHKHARSCEPEMRIIVMKKIVRALAIAHNVNNFHQAAGVGLRCVDPREKWTPIMPACRLARILGQA
jgi:hypothetical protein